MLKKDIISYIEEKGGKSFAEMPLSEVDSLILCQFAYLNLSICGINLGESPKTLRAISQSVDENALVSGVFFPEKNLRLFKLAARSRRFMNVYAAHFLENIDPDNEKQFAAITFRLGENASFIAFRGTDMNFVGWKEDLNLSYLMHIPSQLSALSYLEAVSLLEGEKLFVGGHSKGGNLAVYAAAHASPSIKERLVNVFNHDGPGFLPEFFDGDAFQSVKDKIHKTIPQTAVIGLILETHEAYHVVKINAPTLNQHISFTWEVENGAFVYLDDIDEVSRHTSKVIAEWISGMDFDTRRSFVEALYSVILATKAETLEDLSANWREALRAAVETLKTGDPQTREIINTNISELLRLSAEDFRRSIECMKNGCEEAAEQD